MNTSEKAKKRAAGIFLAIFLLSLLPLYVLGLKAHPSVDDYYYGAETARVWNETRDFGAVVKESWRLMLDSYKTWQGNYAAIFLMRLQPGIFGESAYFITPLILITGFAAAVLCFFYTAFRKLLEADRPAAVAMAAVIVFCALQFTYKPSDSFFWFNGGIYYTFFFSVSLFLYSLIILVMRAERKRVRIAAAAAALPLAFFIGGGNYSTALYSAVLLGCLSAFLFWKKQRAAVPVCVVTAVLAAALLLSVMAPGNAVRQSVAGPSSGVAKALIYSFAYGGYSLANGLNVPVLLMWLGLTPALYKLASKTPFRFRYPLLVLLFTFGIYSSQGTALFYAQGLRMPPRMSNIIYFNAYLFIAFNLTYILGWVHRHFAGGRFAALCESLTDKPKKYTRFALLLFLAFAAGCIGLTQVSERESGGAEFSLQPLSVSASYSLVTGEASHYDSEMTKRADFLSSLPEGAETAVKALSAYPEALVHSEITKDPADFKNEHLAMFYHLSKVWLEE